MKEDRLLISREVYDELAASYERVETLVRLHKAGQDLDTNLIFQILGIGYLLNKEKLDDMEITVNVTGLDNLANAIFALANATGNCKEETQVDATKVTPVVQQAVAPTATTTTVPSTPPVQNVQPVPTTQTAQTAPTVSPVPTATATPTYSMEQLAVAATGLIDAGKMQDVQNTLASLGAQTLMDLPQEKYGEFASAIKAIGAVI